MANLWPHNVYSVYNYTYYTDIDQWFMIYDWVIYFNGILISLGLFYA